LPPPATTHTTTWLWTEWVASCCFCWLLLFQVVQGHVVWLVMCGSQEGICDN